jgi:hypothetical protein
MAIAITSLGKCQILVDTGSSNALEELGYSTDQVTTQQQRFEHPIHSDENGGPEGIPIDIQDLGFIEIVNFELVNFDYAVYEKIAAGYYGQTAGTVGTIGKFLTAGEFRLLLKPNPAATTKPHNYLAAVPWNRNDWAAGVKASRIPMVWRCYPVSGVVWNTTTT